MAWLASLSLDYTQRSGPDGAPRTVAHAVHQGPLRVLQSLYPEPGGVCHTVLVHPPSGLTGGDTLDIKLNLQSGTHSVVTTPGATRFYRSDGEAATQSVHAVLAGGARLEWLPLENIAYSGCIARNRAVFELAPGAELMAWDVTALGLPASGQRFARGSLHQHLEVRGAWIERGLVEASDTRLLDSPLGLNGQRCMATLIYACGEAMARARREELLDSVRALIEAHALAPSAAATAPNPRVVVVRALCAMTEPALGLLLQLRGAWRRLLWQMPGDPPRVWLNMT